MLIAGKIVHFLEPRLKIVEYIKNYNISYIKCCRSTLKNSGTKNEQFCQKCPILPITRYIC